MHWTRSPQERQATKLEKPRRLSSTMVCSPFSRRCADGFHQRARKGGLLARLQKLLRACRSARPRAWAALRCARAVRAACTCRARRCSGFRDWAWPSPAPRTRRPPARARWPRRGRCSAASPPACSCRRALHPPRSAPGCAPARTRRSASPPPPRRAGADAPPLLGALRRR